MYSVTNTKKYLLVLSLTMDYNIASTSASKDTLRSEPRCQRFNTILKAKKALGENSLPTVPMNFCELRNRDVTKEEFLPKVIIELSKFVGESLGSLSFQGAERVRDESWKIYCGRTYQENKQL